MEFKLHSEYQPTGDQPEAIAELVKGFQRVISFRPCLELPVRVRHLQWQISLRR